MTATQLAKQLGITTATLQKWIDGLAAAQPQTDAKGKAVFGTSQQTVLEILRRKVKDEKKALPTAQAETQQECAFREGREKTLAQLKEVRAFMQTLLQD